jgi:hypothetical protein
LMAVSASIEVPVQAAKMPYPDLGVGHATARVHHASRRCGGGMAARRAGAEF